MIEINANYYFEEGSDTEHPILMLHGTGGTERDMRPIAKMINPNAPLLGIRGRLVEQGMTRYFLHDANGGFDIDSLSHETDWLLEQIDLLAEEKGLDPTKMIVVGYSNGANVAAYAMLEKEPKFKSAALFHPMALKATDEFKDRSGFKVWMSHGDRDPICSLDNFNALESFMRSSKIDLTIFEHPQMHNVTREEMVDAHQWYAKNFN